VWEEVEAQAGEQQVVVWVLSSALLQNAYRDFYKAVWDGEGWGADREGVGGGEKRFCGNLWRWKIKMEVIKWR